MTVVDETVRNYLETSETVRPDQGDDESLYDRPEETEQNHGRNGWD